MHMQLLFSYFLTLYLFYNIMSFLYNTYSFWFYIAKFYFNFVHITLRNTQKIIYF